LQHTLTAVEAWDKMSLIKRIRKKDQQRSPDSTSDAQNELLISSKLMADLKNRGILAFKQMSEREQKLVWNWAKEVIRQYRATLEAEPSNIKNVKALPFPKEDIKLAIKLSLPLYISKDIQSMVRILKNAYKELGTFQTIGSQDVERVSSASIENNKSRLSPDQYRDALSSYDKYMDLVVSEKKGLLQEINEFVSELNALKQDFSTSAQN
jgi:hypothetical protein